MKLLKLIDLFIQGILLVGGVIYSALYAEGDRFFTGYFVLGSWQVISWLLHLLDTNNLFFRKERSSYGKILLWLLVIGIVSYLLLFIGGIPLILFYLFALLILSPALAIWYFTICWREIALLNKKALVHLK